jgi:carboxyl-terminal processing protease
MAGIFVDEGSVVQVSRKGVEKPLVLKDVNRGVIWSGPLLLLVNGQSASASELLAATLQDYNRALVVGNATFGKGTGQEILPVENTSGSVVTQSSGSSFAKITTIKTFRNNGTSIQGKGVQPDILLPNVFESYAQKEEDLPHTLVADTIAPYKYFKPLLPITKKTLTALSTARISNNTHFAQLKAAAAPLEIPSFKWEEVEKAVLQDHKDQNIIKGSNFTASTWFTPQLSTTDYRYSSGSDWEKELNKRWVERLSKDIYIEEAFLILKDLIQQTPNK